MIETLKTVLPVVAMLLIGVVTRRKNILSREGVNALKRVVMDITLPGVLLGAFASAQYSAQSAIWPLVMFLACFAALGLGYLGKRALKIASPFAPFLSTGYEAGMLGYALFSMLYGKENVADFALIDLGQVLFVFTVYKALLRRAQGGKMTLGETARDLASSPTIWAIVAGVLIGATGLYKSMAPWGGDELLTAITDFAAGPTGAIILITIGYDLSFDIAKIKPALSTIVMRLAISAAIMGGVLALAALWLKPGAYARAAIILMFILPPPYVLPIMADDPAEREYVSSSLCALTLITIICFAVLAGLPRV